MGVLKQLNGDKYAVIEVNFLAGRRTGHVKAQLPLDATDFEEIKAENGMLLAYDPVAGSVKLPAGVTTPVMLHFSVEKEYDHIRPGLKNFALGLGEFYPRLFGLYPGDVWTTDAVRLLAGTNTDAEVEAAYEALSPSNTTAYAVGVDGWISTVAAATAGNEAVLVKVIKKTTLPNGGKAVKVEVVKA